MLHQPFFLVRARFYLLVVALGIFFPAASRAQLVVDCTGGHRARFRPSMRR